MRAQVAAIYGSNNQTLTSEVHFFAFPLWAALAIALIILLLITARRRLLKVITILVKG